MSAVIQEPLDVNLSLVRSGLAIERFRPALGATVHGIDLGQPLSDNVRDQLRQAVVEHGVLFFHGQKLNAGQLTQFSKIFGEPLRHNPYLPSAAEHQGVESIEVSETKNVRNDAWHADVTWVDPAPRFTVLHAQVLPPAGGDTVWTNTVAAYESLAPELAAYLETLSAVNAFDANGFAITDVNSDRAAEIRVNHPPIEVPVIKTHPENGKKYIFITEQHTRYLKGLTRSTSESLLRLLFGVLEQPEFQIRFEWQPHSLAVWDNRLVQHRAIRDYGTTRRVLHRITIA